ncbi:hypothetical protein [Halobacillus mangrovi]|uniref:hypothetical protein n=1 Tax=Halobacillus mangrovi TaxID=402384 RepID=UPI0012F4BE6B|nr:hypothetical protein [Halobacillus mangrovi]
MIEALRSYFSKDFSWIPQETPPHTSLQLAGKLLLKRELPFSEKEITSLVEQSILTAIPSIEKHVWVIVVVAVVTKKENTLLNCLILLVNRLVPTVDYVFRWGE